MQTYKALNKNIVCILFQDISIFQSNGKKVQKDYGEPLIHMTIEWSRILKRLTMQLYTVCMTMTQLLRRVHVFLADMG